MSDERQQQIVDAARQLYEEQGLSATTVKDISERCGVARSLFYHYFRNKQEVTSAVIDDFVNSRSMSRVARASTVRASIAWPPLSTKERLSPANTRQSSL